LRPAAEVAILHPRQGQTLAVDHATQLAGSATDTSEMPIASEALAWACASRYLIACEALSTTRGQLLCPSWHFRRLFENRRGDVFTGAVARALPAARKPTVSGIINERAWLGQEKGPEVELIVSGTTLYATYETLDGFPAVYDDARGLFCYARIVDGRYESSGVPVTSSPPAGVERHARESDAVRQARIVERQAQMDRRATREPERK
jgi:hypothetical protein